MVLLTMTPALVAAIQKHKSLSTGSETLKLTNTEISEAEPLLKDPQVGNPISHTQIISLSRHLRNLSTNPSADDSAYYNIDNLLLGSKVYVPPPPTKHEPVSHLNTLCTGTINA